MSIQEPLWYKSPDQNFTNKNNISCSPLALPHIIHIISNCPTPAHAKLLSHLVTNGSNSKTSDGKPHNISHFKQVKWPTFTIKATFLKPDLPPCPLQSPSISLSKQICPQAPTFSFSIFISPSLSYACIHTRACIASICVQLGLIKYGPNLRWLLPK